MGEYYVLRVDVSLFPFLTMPAFILLFGTNFVHHQAFGG